MFNRDCYEKFYKKHYILCVFWGGGRHQDPFTYSLLLLLTHSFVMNQVNLTFLRLALNALPAQLNTKSPGFAGAFSLSFQHHPFSIFSAPPCQNRFLTCGDERFRQRAPERSPASPRWAAVSLALLLAPVAARPSLSVCGPYHRRSADRRCNTYRYY